MCAAAINSGGAEASCGTPEPSTATAVNAVLDASSVMPKWLAETSAHSSSSRTNTHAAGQLVRLPSKSSAQSIVG